MSEKPKHKRGEKGKHCDPRRSSVFRAGVIFLSLILLVTISLLITFVRERTSNDPSLTATILIATNATTEAQIQGTGTQSAIKLNNTQIAATFIAENPTATPSPCPFMWGTSDDTQGQEKLNTALIDGGYEVEVTVSAYGEYACENFHLMDTTPRITILVDNLEDEAALGEIVRDVLLAIDAVEITRPREVWIIFTLRDTDQSITWSMRYSDAVTLLESPLSELLSAGVTLEED